MTVKFWGVRGSLPTPVTSFQIQSKISAVVQRITPDDLVSPDDRERFMASLPEYMLGTTGGNTACVELTGQKGTKIILDAGSGIRALGKEGGKSADNHYNIILSHLHWDHIQGFPFFDPLFDGRTTIDCYSTNEAAESALRAQMSEPCFPVKFDTVADRITFHTIKAGSAFEAGEFDVHCCMMEHPGGSTAYSFTERDGAGESGAPKKFVYATDVELRVAQADETDESAKEAVFSGADCVVLDSQYTVAEAYKKGGWGHSAFCYAVDFAAKWDIKSLYLFHHEPTYNDKKLYNILETARWYAQYIERSDVKVYLAREGLAFQI